MIGALLLAGGGVASAVFLVLMMLEAFVDGDGALSITQALLLATGGAALSGLGLYLASSAILHMRDWVGGAMAVFGAATIPAVTTLVLMTDTEGLETLDVPSVVLLVIGAVGALTAGLRIRRKRLAATVVLIGAALYALTLGGLAALA